MEGRDQHSRAQQRKKLGTLRDLTVQPSTRKRYDSALTKFFSWLRENRLKLPAQKDRLDNILSDYLEFLWSSGEGRALASDTLASIQDKQPSVRGSLSGSWRLLKTWHTNEVPNRAPPLPEKALQAMIGYSLFHNMPEFALSLWLGFFGLLRTGELLNIRAAHLQQNKPNSPVILSLGLTKGGKRVGAAESVTFGETEILRRVHQWKCSVAPQTLLTSAPHVWRKTFTEVLQALGFTEFQFRPYSLRRGGATHWFHKHGSFDRLLIQGRWQGQRTARIYLNDGLSLLAETHLPWTASNKGYLTIFHHAISHPLPELDPALKRRAGGTGKRKRSGQNSALIYFFAGCQISRNQRLGP